MKKLRNFILHKLRWSALYDLKRESGLKKLGWFKSYDQAKPIDAEGNPIPWITYPAIHFLNKKLNSKFKKLNVFEFGSGFSSLWWAGNNSTVHSVEHDLFWFKTMHAQGKSNLKFYHAEVDSEQYIAMPSSLGLKFDVIVVDGRRRNECIKTAVENLNETGIVILDNSDRERYLPGIEYLTARGFSQVEFGGMVPMGVELSETSIFFRPNNILGI